eukprot:6248487-Pyramimonas_sp.AAC.2
MPLHGEDDGSWRRGGRALRDEVVPDMMCHARGVAGAIAQGSGGRAQWGRVSARRSRVGELTLP